MIVRESAPGSCIRALLYMLRVTFAQAHNLVTMLTTSGAAKKESCEILDTFEHQVGQEGLKHIMDCVSDFPTAFKNAKAFCASDDTSGDSSTDDSSDFGELCDTAKALVHFYVCTRVYVQIYIVVSRSLRKLVG